MAYWLGFQAFTAVAQVQSLVGELRSHKLCSSAKKKKKKKSNHIKECTNATKGAKIMCYISDKLYMTPKLFKL